MEANIIYRITKGDERAFDRMMDAWSARLYRYALNITRSSEVAEEVVSDVFLEVWKSRGSLLEIASLESWLRTVTYRKAVTALRHLASRPEGVSLDEVAQFIMDPIPSPDEDIISREEGERLNEAIRQLPDKCRHVFYLAKIDCISYKEIAAMLDITVATVNYHVGYAMDSLRRALRTPS
ncbi:sigma-70 family RNA polymerase sigma factor [uncultured Muribaculum sp.]|uniref:RNA polymerase sigma factor n=1 Tax=uncultured Muribaculum sp. TaxID=1918613 RepID=UPI0025CD9159|nr:sigma-70 family RNA polymerase sigma factor [uncultured Muribaculum sp.]